MIKRNIKLLSGNTAGAYAVLLCQPDVVAGYPITPQTALLEKITQFCANGLLKARTVEVEGEQSALSVLIGAAAAGARTFTATSSQGLAFMYEAYCRVPILRLPIVMAIAGREMDAPPSAGLQDAILVRDAGWIQIYVESCQEILDSIIMAYRLAEDPEIMLPINVIYDGFYLSHLSEPVEIPLPEQVRAFLPPYNPGPFRLDPEAPMQFPERPFAVPTGRLITEFRYRHCAALQKAKTKIEEQDKEFQQIFGRSHGGLIEEYRCDDAEIVLVTMGSCAGTAREVVDRKRKEGIKVGLVKVRVLRPFPKEKLAQAIKNKKSIGVIDRNVCFGWNSGTLFMELQGMQGAFGISIPMISFIDGLGGSDITLGHLERVVNITAAVARGELYEETVWLTLEGGK